MPYILLQQPLENYERLLDYLGDAVLGIFDDVD
jgi:hypothetical protein